MPGVQEKHTQMRERRKQCQICLSILLDYSKAHRLIKIKADEHGFLACRLDGTHTWVNCVGTFGVGSAAYWWSRMAGAQIRLLHGLLAERWPLEALLFADDAELTASNAREREGVVMAIFILMIIGAPMKLSKFRGGFTVNWIGMTIDNRLYALGLAQSRADWLVGWAKDIIEGKTVEVTNFSGGVGRLNFAANALIHEKPWLGPLYAWSSTIQTAGHTSATVPWGIKFVLLWISKRLSSSCRMMITPTLPSRVGHLFKSDAKAEQGRATIGGWECRGGTPPAAARWWYVEIFEATTPWVFAKSGDPQRVIATLELLGTLLCLVLFHYQADDMEAGVITISATTDNAGNSLVMQKYMSTKWPLSPVLCELSEQLRTRNLELHLDWQRRDCNIEADAITNEDYSMFTPCNRIAVDFAQIKWIVLNEAMTWSKEVYDHCQEAKLRRNRPEFVPTRIWKKRKTAAAKRLRATAPW
jgi:hypothetical protein